MHCTRCGAELSSAGQSCPNCPPVDEWAEIRRQLDYLKTVAGYQQGALSRLEAAVDRLGAGSPPAGPMPPTVQPTAEAVVPLSEAVAPESPPDPPPSPAPEPEVQPTGPASPPKKRQTSGWEVRLGQRLLLGVGVVVMVFAVGYFLKYSFDQGWIGPAGQVAAVYLWGAALLAAGERFRRQGPRGFGLSLTGGGVAVLYFATFAAFELYSLFGQLPAFFGMCLITALAAALAVAYDARGLAVLGLLGGFLTPILLGSGSNRPLALLIYISVLNLGLLAVAFHKRWRVLTGLGLTFTYLLLSIWLVSRYRDDMFWPTILFLNLYFLLYTVMPLAYSLWRTTPGLARGLPTLFVNATLAFTIGFLLVADHADSIWASLLSLFYTAVFLGAAELLRRRGQTDQPAFVGLLAGASVFLAITIPLLLTGQWVTLFWAAQALALLGVGLHLHRRLILAASAVLACLALGKLWLIDYLWTFALRLDTWRFDGGYTAGLDERLVAASAVLACLWVWSAPHRLFRRDTPFAWRAPGAVAAGLFGLTLLGLLSVEAAAFCSDYLPDARAAALSVVWALFSVGLTVTGFARRSRAMRRLAMGLFAVTVFKVFLVDMAAVSTPWRIVSFFVLGMVLLGASFLYYRFRDTIDPPPPGDPS